MNAETGWAIFVFLILFGLLESVLTLFWVPFYMRLGIPIFLTRFSILNQAEFANGGAKLIEEGLAGKWYPSLIFKQINDTELAFKNKPLEFKIGFRVRSPMRGIVQLDSSYQVSFKGFLPFATPFIAIAFIILFATTFGSQFERLSGQPIWPIMIAIIAINFVIQIVVYTQVSKRVKAYFEQSLRF